MVSILTRPFGRVLPASIYDRYARFHQVSILTRPFGRVLQVAEAVGRAPERVSILTRPFGRVLPLSGAAYKRYVMFQSSPGLSAGCCFRLAAGRLGRECFNPHPAFRPGAAAYTITASARSSSFQSSPGLSAGCCSPPQVANIAAGLVSILTRPFGRVLLTTRAAASRVSRFNPHPAFRPGAAGCSAPSKKRPSCFNPHPAFRPGAARSSRRGKPPTT